MSDEEWLKNQPYGKGLQEHKNEFNKWDAEFHINLAPYTAWLTALASGEVVFILSNKNSDGILLYKNNLFIVVFLFLLVSILFGLLYHLLRIVQIWCERRFHSYGERLFSKYFTDDVMQKPKTDTLQETKKYREEMNSCHNSWMFIWARKGINFSAGINVATFFIGSFFLVWLVARRLLSQ